MNGGAPEAVEVGAHAVEREAGLRGLPGQPADARALRGGLRDQVAGGPARLDWGRIWKYS